MVSTGTHLGRFTMPPSVWLLSCECSLDSNAASTWLALIERRTSKTEPSDHFDTGTFG